MSLSLGPKNVPVSFKRVALRKLSVTDVTFVRFFSRVNPEMTLQLERIRTGVGAVGALVRPLSCVTSTIMEKHMSY